MQGQRSVPPVSGVDLNDQSVTLDYAKDKPTVLYFITASGLRRGERAGVCTLVHLTGSQYNFFVIAVRTMKRIWPLRSWRSFLVGRRD
jgi:hypothetical protein